MFKVIIFKLLIVILFLTLVFCNSVQPESQYGSISGKVLHPDNNLVICIISTGRIDTVLLDPESHLFTSKSYNYGNYILQVSADGYGRGYEEKIVLDKPVFTCNDIILSRTPPQIAYLFPSNSQNFDMNYFNLYESQVTDSGVNPEITFNQEMDTTSVNNALTILPDTVGVEVIWSINRVLVVHFPYWKLAKIDTVRVSVNTKAVNIYGDSLDFSYTIFYPVDKEYIRDNCLKKN